MTSRDYTKEVGITSHKKTLSRPLAFVVLAIVAVGISFGIAGVMNQTKENHAAEKARENSSAAAPVAVAPVPEPAPAK